MMKQSTTDQPTAGDTLRARLTYEPKELNFGTSGRRGEVVHLTQLEVYSNVLAELEYLQSLPPKEGGIVHGQEFYLSYDLRPSSTVYVPEQQGRGELAQAVVRAIQDAGMLPVNLGQIPTPALTYYAISRARGSVMITGSHIPFDRNGYKLNTSIGELLKKDEEPINQKVRSVRERLYRQSYCDSLFNERGLFKMGHQELPPETTAGRLSYLERYESFFQNESLRGKRVLVYQHSAVGRDILVDILKYFDAEVIPSGRSERFIPIDTENIDDAQLAVVQAIADEVCVKYGRMDAIVSTDGDSDRPLILGIDSATGQVRFFGGDQVGMVVAEYLQADCVVVPISCNDGIDRGRLKDILDPKTRIGSPYVIAAMEKARNKGKQRICGWEANGGFLTGSDICRNGRVLKALPTRDALLPILCVLFAAQERGTSLNNLFAVLPKRFSRSALLKEFPRPVALRLVAKYSPTDPGVQDVLFAGAQVFLFDENQAKVEPSHTQVRHMEAIRAQLESYFTPEMGFGPIMRLNYTDGVRILFGNGDVAHFRPSGNADEVRIYAVADTQARANVIAELGGAEPDGILRMMERKMAQT